MGYILDMIRWERRDAKEEGRLEGQKEGMLKNCRENILELLENLAPVPEKLQNRILSETNIEVLRQMFKVAVKADTMEEFKEAVSNL